MRLSASKLPPLGPAEAGPQNLRDCPETAIWPSLHKSYNPNFSPSLSLCISNCNRIFKASKFRRESNGRLILSPETMGNIDVTSSCSG
ncbi:hypothetical protein FF2_034625 [Malus domestica]